jgi:hypothetical protein
MSVEQFAKDKAAVEKDLRTLKDLLECDSNGPTGIPTTTEAEIITVSQI